MKKKIILIISVCLVIFLGYIGYALLTTKSHSPFQKTSHSFAGVEVSVAYCQPYKKGRLIFGTKAEGALQPFGEYWRLGANEATEITFSSDVRFGGSKVNAGTYRMYVVPNADAWEVSLNSELGKWGAMEPDYSLDIVKIKVPVQQSEQVVEQFTIRFDNENDGAKMKFLWDTTYVVIPLTK